MAYSNPLEPFGTREERANRTIIDILAKMDSTQIEDLAEILKHWDDYQTFFNVINSNARVTNWNKKR